MTLINFKSNKGYTLVELLAVIVVMIVVGVIISSILVSSLRGGNKTSTVNEVRDNGNTAMTRMARAIEFAKRFEGVSEVNLDGPFRSDCLPEEVGPLTPTPTPVHYKHIKIRAFDEGETTLSCLNSTIASTSATGATMALISESGISAPDSSCYFTCNQAFISQPPTIGINFTLSKGASSLFFEQKFSTDFHTSVVMRNLGP